MGGTASSEKAPPSPLFVWIPEVSKTTPDFIEGKLSADPNYGFEGKQRKERVMIATEAELQSAKVPFRHRGFCAHKYIQFQKCKKDKFPFVYRCHPEKHEWHDCQQEDYLIRMKEYERERRLLHHKARKDAKAQKEAAANYNE